MKCTYITILAVWMYLLQTSLSYLFQPETRYYNFIWKLSLYEHHVVPSLVTFSKKFATLERTIPFLKLDYKATGTRSHSTVAAIWNFNLSYRISEWSFVLNRLNIQTFRFKRNLEGYQNRVRGTKGFCMAARGLEKLHTSSTCIFH